MDATALYKVRPGFFAKHRGLMHPEGTTLELTRDEADLLAVQVELVIPDPEPEPVKRTRSKASAE